MRSRIRNALLCGAVLLGCQQALAGETAFSRLDRDANGFIEAADMAAMHERMFRRLDRNVDGVLSRRELTPPSTSNHPSPNAVVWPDRDGDDRISPAEFMAQEPALILRGDSDGDHRLSAEEFRQMIAARGQ